jgi:hypothetical protein
LGFTNDHHIQISHPSKLTPEQCLLLFILYMKHYHVSMYDAFVWKWSKNVICDDAIFITSCINDVIGNEIWWPTTQEQVVLGTWTYWNFKVTLGSLMAHSSRFANLGMMGPTRFGSMGTKRFTQWIIVSF